MDNIKYIEALHVKMHDTFREVINFLEGHNLKWYCCGGTAIGAIRHHDFIPWDDDIDIYMPRADYNVLLSLKNEVKSSTNLELVNIDDDGYTQWFAKFVDKHSTTLENLDIPLIHGVWVDVFPLDYSSKSELENAAVSKEYRKRFIKYQQAILPNSLKSTLYNLYRLRIRFVLEKLITFLHKGRRQSLKKQFKEYDESLQEKNGNYLVSYCENGRKLDCDWFKSSKWVNFCDYKVRVPLGYDAYLRSVYGNYMELPRIEDRVTHQMKYVNLKERLSRKEIIKRLQSGETFIG